MSLVSYSPRDRNHCQACVDRGHSRLQCPTNNGFPGRPHNDPRSPGPCGCKNLPLPAQSLANAWAPSPFGITPQMSISNVGSPVQPNQQFNFQNVLAQSNLPALDTFLQNPQNVPGGSSRYTLAHADAVAIFRNLEPHDKQALVDRANKILDDYFRDFNAQVMSAYGGRTTAPPAVATPAPTSGLFGPTPGSTAPPPPPTGRVTQGIVLGSVPITNRRTGGSADCETALSLSISPANFTSLIASRGLTNYLGLAQIALSFVAPANLTGMSATVIFIFHNAAITAPTTLAAARLSPGRIHEMSLTSGDLSSQNLSAQLNYSPNFPATDTLHICVVIRAWGAGTATSGASAVQVGGFNLTIGATTS